MRVRRAARRPLIMVPLGIVVTAIAVTLIAVLVVIPLVEGGGDRDDGGTGAGGEPPPQLVTVRDSLPLYPGATIDTDVWTGGPQFSTFYWLQGEPEAVMAFYGGQLLAEGWQPEGPATDTTTEKGGVGYRSISRSFLKGDLRLTITVVPNFKDPSRGATRLAVLLEPR